MKKNIIIPTLAIFSLTFFGVNVAKACGCGAAVSQAIAQHIQTLTAGFQEVNQAIGASTTAITGAITASTEAIVQALGGSSALNKGAVNAQAATNAKQQITAQTKLTQDLIESMKLIEQAKYSQKMDEHATMGQAPFVCGNSGIGETMEAGLAEKRKYELDFVDMVRMAYDGQWDHPLDARDATTNKILEYYKEKNGEIDYPRILHPVSGVVEEKDMTVYMAAIVAMFNDNPSPKVSNLENSKSLRIVVAQICKNLIKSPALMAYATAVGLQAPSFEEKHLKKLISGMVKPTLGGGEISQSNDEYYSGLKKTAKAMKFNQGAETEMNPRLISVTSGKKTSLMEVWRWMVEGLRFSNVGYWEKINNQTNEEGKTSEILNLTLLMAHMQYYQTRYTMYMAELLANISNATAGQAKDDEIRSSMYESGGGTPLKNKD